MMNDALRGLHVTRHQFTLTTTCGLARYSPLEGMLPSPSPAEYSVFSFRGLIGFPGVNVWDSAFSYLLAVVKSSLLKVRGKIQVKKR